MTRPEATLFINLNDSTCGACGRGADYSEEEHITALGYFASDILDDPDHPMRKGCGARFVRLSSHYSDFGDLYERVQELRPDLPFMPEVLSDGPVNVRIGANPQEEREQP